MDCSLRYCISLLVPKHVHSPERTLSFDRRRNCAYVSSSCCVAAWLADWEQRVWLCKPEVSISYPPLLSLAALPRDLAVKSTTRGRRHSAASARSQLDVRDAKRWKMNAAEASFHLGDIPIPVSPKWFTPLSRAVCAPVFPRARVCVCVHVFRCVLSAAEIPSAASSLWPVTMVIPSASQ